MDFAGRGLARETLILSNVIGISRAPANVSALMRGLLKFSQPLFILGFFIVFGFSCIRVVPAILRIV